MKSVPTEIWHGCFDDSWRDMITPDAFAHPAKFARGLIQRIIIHGLAAGWWETGDTIGDPFGGIGTGGIISAYHGLAWKGVELEPRFCKLAKENFDSHLGRWNVLGAPLPELFQGDSRQFATIIGAAAAVVTSPPYAQNRFDGGKESLKHKQGFSRGYSAEGGYAENSEGQIASLKSGDLSAVVTSPPYNKPFSQDHNGSRGGQRSLGNAPSSEAGAFVVYGHTEGQIEGMPNGEVDAVVTSPPYGGEVIHARPSKMAVELHAGRQCATGLGEYGTTEGQIQGSPDPETYWQAMAQVYAQCFLALRPGGVACVNVKDYVKEKARVPLCDQTLTLLRHVGFEPVTRIHAMLVKEHRTNTLFAGEQVHLKERKSFFRRLAEKKGSPRIDHEEILVVRKP